MANDWPLLHLPKEPFFSLLGDVRPHSQESSFRKMIFLVLHQSKRAVHSHLSIRTKPSAGANVFVFVIALRILAWPMIGLSSTCRRLPFISLLGAVRPRSRESSLRKMIFLVLHQSMRQFFSVLSRSSHSLSNSLAWSTFLGTNVFVFVLALGNPRSGK